MIMRLLGLFLLGAALPCLGGSIIITGHDSDFHAHPDAAENRIGAIHTINRFVDYVNKSAGPVVFIHDHDPLHGPGDPLPHPCPDVLACSFDSQEGLLAANPGFIPVTTPAFLSLDLSTVGALIVPSSFGGNLTEDQVKALKARKKDLATFVASGGGMVVLSEEPVGLPDLSLVPASLTYSFLPFGLTATRWSQPEIGFTLTPFGTSLGLTTSDINGSFSHLFFDPHPTFKVIDLDSEGRIISFSRDVIPEPGTMLLVGSGLAGLLLRRKRAC